MSHVRARMRRWLVALLVLTGGVVLVSCSLFTYHAMPMQALSIPGAEYIGMQNCAVCHPQQYRYFQFSVHRRVAIETDEENPTMAEGCETCHGPGSLHGYNRGDGPILKASVDSCFSCHMDIQGKFRLQYHHPVTEGRMFCSDCHSPHGQDIQSGPNMVGRSVPTASLTGLAVGGQDEACFRCHKEMRGPWVYEHDPMREGCTTCHNPHGSIFDKLLVAGPSQLCLRCHWQPAFNSATADLGDRSHRNDFIRRGQDCIDCHRATHGSNVARAFNE